MYINTFKYTPKDVSCQLCTEYVKKLGCTALRCPWLAERIEAGVVGYREAVMETFPRDRRLSSRLNLLIKHYPGSLWSCEQHERRMQYQCAVQGYRRRRDTNAYYAAMYLLTSNDDIYQYVFPMIDEMAEACRADAVHIGMDELFDVAMCPRCKGKSPAALYARTIKIDLATLKPTVAFPHLPENTKTIDEAEKLNIKIDQVVIGSCTNGRYSDLEASSARLHRNP